MALKYADFCVRCGTTRTKHPSGMCSRCRRIQAQIDGKRQNHMYGICKQCGRRAANGEDGLCSTCRQSNSRSSGSFEDKIDKAINKCKDQTFILERRKEGNSFATIAKMLGATVPYVFRAYSDAMGLRAKSGFVDYVDEQEMPALDAEDGVDEPVEENA